MYIKVFKSRILTTDDISNDHVPSGVWVFVLRVPIPCVNLWVANNIGRSMSGPKGLGFRAAAGRGLATFGSSYSSQLVITTLSNQPFIRVYKLIIIR